MILTHRFTHSLQSKPRIFSEQAEFLHRRHVQCCTPSAGRTFSSPRTDFSTLHFHASRSCWRCNLHQNEGDMPLTTIYGADRTTIVEDNIVVTCNYRNRQSHSYQRPCRMRYGSNLYEISAIRQWLNSEDATFVATSWTI